MLRRGLPPALRLSAPSVQEDSCRGTLWLSIRTLFIGVYRTVVPSIKGVRSLQPAHKKSPNSLAIQRVSPPLSVDDLLAGGRPRFRPAPLDRPTEKIQNTEKRGRPVNSGRAQKGPKPSCVSNRVANGTGTWNSLGDHKPLKLPRRS